MTQDQALRRDQQSDENQAQEPDAGIMAAIAGVVLSLDEALCAIGDAQTAFDGTIMHGAAVGSALTQAFRATRRARSDTDAIHREVAALHAFVREWWNRNVDQPFDRDDGKLFDMARALLMEE